MAVVRATKVFVVVNAVLEGRVVAVLRVVLQTTSVAVLRAVLGTSFAQMAPALSRTLTITPLRLRRRSSALLELRPAVFRTIPV
jgi:hypothetical protein